MNVRSQKFRRYLRLILTILQLAIDIMICFACLEFSNAESPGIQLFVTGCVIIFFAFSSLYGFQYLTFRYGIRACLRSVFYAWLVSMLFAYSSGCSAMLNISAGLAMFIPAVLAARYIVRLVISALGIVPPTLPENVSELFTGSVNASPFTLRKIKSFLDEDTAKKGSPISREQVMEKIKDFRKLIGEHKNS